LYLPLTRALRSAEIDELKKGLLEFETCVDVFEERTERPVSFADSLAGQLPPHLLASLPRSIDFIGDIAVVEIPPELETYKSIIGKAVLTAHKKVRTVLAKWSPVTGVYRLRTFEVIGGEAKTQTVHREHGCAYFVDLAKAYFTPRLSYEHARVASLVMNGETVVDMFAGVGPFSIQIAKRRATAHVYAIDVNPDAYEFLRKNVLANRVEAKVSAVLGDARQIVNEKLSGVADRIIMNLPESAVEYIDVACNALKSTGGVVHFYQFADSPEPTEAAKARLDEAVKKTGRHMKKALHARIVRGIAPFTYQVVVDAEIK
jgi:tRNA (guanine37-N1)-methyltransferase